MAMTLRLTAEADRALTLLAQARGTSKHEAALRAIIAEASRSVADAEVAALAREIIPHYAHRESRIRQAR